MLKNAPTLAIVAVHTDENEPFRVLVRNKFKKYKYSYFLFKAQDADFGATELNVRVVPEITRFFRVSARGVHLKSSTGHASRPNPVGMRLPDKGLTAAEVSFMPLFLREVMFLQNQYCNFILSDLTSRTNTGIRE